jgi:hypothetical protein
VENLENMGVNWRVATFSFNTHIRVLTNAVKVFESGETKKEVENDLFSCMAPQVGLEPTTYGLTVRRSNQLSY